MLSEQKLEPSSFQSAPPLRGATNFSDSLLRRQRVSIRAPLARGDFRA